jgi:cytochrome c-type biogenesis protein CcmH
VRHILAALALLAAVTLPALAVEPNERLADPVLEARAREISKNLRCLVCQNESIDESNADLAHDVRVLLRQRLVAGDTDAQAIKFIVDRYGQFVLLRPPVEPATYVLWFGPAIVVVLAAAGTALAVRNRRRGAAGPAPLSEAEQERLARIMRESDG